jgi:hypothetical protein
VAVHLELGGDPGPRHKDRPGSSPCFWMFGDVEQRGSPGHVARDPYQYLPPCSYLVPRSCMRVPCASTHVHVVVCCAALQWADRRVHIPVLTLQLVRNQRSALMRGRFWAH